VESASRLLAFKYGVSVNSHLSFFTQGSSSWQYADEHIKMNPVAKIKDINLVDK